MCIYWRKEHLCGCASRFYLDICHPALMEHTQCAKPSEDPVLRKSYFQCYSCIRDEVFAERAANIRAAEEAFQKAQLAEQKANEDKKKAEERARVEKIHKAAEARAQKERNDEEKKERDRRAEIERQRREGPAWVEASAGRKGKGWKGTGGGSEPGTPTALMTPTKILTNAPSKGMGMGMGSLKAPSQAPPTVTAPAGVDPGGRAGRWGPAKKVVKENERPEDKGAQRTFAIRRTEEGLVAVNPKAEEARRKRTAKRNLYCEKMEAKVSGSPPQSSEGSGA